MEVDVGGLVADEGAYSMGPRALSCRDICHPRVLKVLGSFPLGGGA